MRGVLRRTVALSVGLLAADLTMYSWLGLLWVTDGGTRLFRSFEAVAAFNVTILAVAFLASVGLGVKALESAARRLGVSQEPIGVAGLARQVASFLAGVGAGVGLGLSIFRVLVVLSRGGLYETSATVARRIALAVLPAIPLLGLVVTRAVLRGGRGAAPSGGAGAGAVTASPVPPPSEDGPLVAAPA